MWDYSLFIEKQLTLEKYKKAIPDPMKLEFEEAIYKRFLILTKKRYMAIKCVRDGVDYKKLETKGVLLARRDNSGFLRALYKDVVWAILQDKGFHFIRYEILEPFIDDIMKCDFNKEEVYEKFIKSSSVGDWIGETEKKDGLYIGEYKYRPLPKDFKKRKARLKALYIPDRHKFYNCKGICESCTFCKTEEEDYKEKFLPAIVQLAIRLGKRGVLVSPGERLNYVIIKNGTKQNQLCFKIEDPEYVKKYKKYIKIDKLHYFKNCIKPIDQLLEIGCRQVGVLKNILKVKEQVHKDKIEKIKLKIKIKEYGKLNMPNTLEENKIKLPKALKYLKMDELKEHLNTLKIKLNPNVKYKKKDYITLLEPHTVYKSKRKVELKEKTPYINPILDTSTNTDFIYIERNKFNNYEHLETHLVFDRNEKVVIGVQEYENEIIKEGIKPLSKKDLDNCCKIWISVYPSRKN